MKKLYTKFFLITLTLLCSQPCTYTMEPNIDKSRVPSLKNICLNYISTHINETNAIPNLSNLPVNLASEIVLGTSLLK